jgi:predicted RND superfamily exporter protein
MNFNKLILKLAQSQVENPSKYLIASLFVTIIAAIITSGLKFDSSYEALLPQNSKELKNTDNVRNKTGGTRQLVIAISGKNKQQRIAFGKKIKKQLESLKNIRFVDLSFPVDFFKTRGLWLLDINTLNRLVPAVKNALDIAKAQANPLALHLDEAEEKKELKEAWDRVDKIISSEKKNIPFKQYMVSKDGRYTFLLAVPTIKFSDMAAGHKLLTRIKSIVQKANPQKEGLTVKYAGALEVLQEQQQVTKRDLRNASILAMQYGIFIVAGFTRKATAPFLIGTGLLAGITWTLAAATLLIGHVNIITGFLVAVLIGLGIDFGIHLFIRYQQESQQKGASIESAVTAFVTGTASPAITSALTTAGVFFSFTFADFRGFSEFGLIAGIGIMLTLVSSFLIMPPLLLIVYRKMDTRQKTFKKTTAVKQHMPLPYAVSVVTVMLLLAAWGAASIFSIPFKNNFRKLRGHSDATAFFDYVDKNLGAGFNPAVFLANSIKDADKISAILREEISKDKNSNKIAKLSKTIGAGDLLPRNSAAHKKKIDELKKMLLNPSLDKAAQKRGEQAEKLKTARKMVQAEPWTFNEIPTVFKRRFTTIDKKNPQYIIYAWPQGQNDADYKAAAWKNRLNEISEKLSSDGIEHQMADETLIVAWIYEMIKKDGIPLLSLAAIIVIIFLAIDFKRPKDVLLLIFSLTVGMLTFVGIAHLLSMEINMFNMIVLPSIIGIGIDNAVHIFHRYKEEGKGSIMFVVKNTGAAALLASLTTAVGFGSSLISHNVGLKTMGSLAIVGIGSTFAAAVIFFPALLTILERITNNRQP